MKIFVYTLREFDELPFFEKFSKQYGVEFGYTTQSPGPENYHLAKGYDAISIITTPTPAEMIDAMKENGVKVISTRTIGYDIFPKDAVRQHAEYVDLDTLYAESDIITLHAPALEDNYHMIDETAFSKMKDGVILVNCARGQLVDTEAMIRSLSNGKIGFAALDVIEKELGIYYKDLSGTIIDNPEMAILRSFYNVFFSPHTAFYTEEAVANMVENSILGIQAYLKGEDHPFIVKKY